MFVVTADQRGSRTSTDLVPSAITAIAEGTSAGTLALAPERTTGDELQVATSDAGALLRIILTLTRSAVWSVGVGVGDIEKPLPVNVRAARGDAFIKARDAVDSAKKAHTRLAIRAEGGTDAEALVRLLIELRDRRTDEGWEVYDLLAEGLTQREAAVRLGITEGAVSLRAKAAALRVEEAAIPALERVLARLDAP